MAGKAIISIRVANSAHDKGIELICFDRRSNVIQVCFPVCTTYRLHPLDVSSKLMLQRRGEANNGQSVTTYEVGKLFKPGFLSVAGSATNIFEIFLPKITFFFAH